MRPHDSRRIDLLAPIPRRAFLGLAGALATAPLLGCAEDGDRAGDASPSGTKPHAGRTLRVFVYSGAWEKTFREAFVPRFEAMTGATVIPDPGWWDSIPKLKASPPGKPAFDLVLTDATQGYPAIREGLFQQIDLNRISNRAKLAKAVLDHWVHHDGYGIPFPDSAMTLAWNRKLVGFEPAGWSDLLRDEIAGRLGMYNSFYMSLFTFACMKVASEGRAGSAAQACANDLAGVLDFARRQRDRVKYWWPTSTDMALNLAQENCAIGNMHGTDMLPALRQHATLGAVVPAEDRAFVQLMWVVPAGTACKDLAEEAIDFLLSEEMQEAFARNGSATGVVSVAQKMAAADPIWGSIYPSTEEALAKVQYYPYDAYFADWDAIVATWDRQVLRKG